MPDPNDAVASFFNAVKNWGLTPSSWLRRYSPLLFLLLCGFASSFLFGKAMIRKTSGAEDFILTLVIGFPGLVGFLWLLFGSIGLLLLGNEGSRKWVWYGSLVFGCTLFVQGFLLYLFRPQ